MHEMSLLADLLRKIETMAKDNNATRVTGVSIWLGALAHISAHHLYEHFRDATQGTVAEGACLFVEESDDERDPNAQDIVLKSIDIESDD